MPQMNMLQAVHRALEEEMERDADVLVLGEDVGVAGGVFRATEGFYQKFGEDRAVPGEVPLDDYTVPLGVARVVRPGRDVTLVVWGAMVQVAEQAVPPLEERGIDVEIIDLRTISPLDRETLLASARKTGRVVIVHEAPKTGGVGGEIAAIIAEEAIDALQAPGLRVRGPDTPFPYAPERAYMPNVIRVLDAVTRPATYW